MSLQLETHDAVAADAHRDDVLQLWGTAFGAVIDAQQWRETLWDRHRYRSGYRLVTAHEGGRLVGFGWGYTGEAGQYWTDMIAARLGPAVDGWVGGHFELVELAVAREARGRGVGRSLHDALMDGLPQARALLSTADDLGDPGAIFFAGRGWQRLGSPAAGKQVMGMRLRVSEH